MKPWRDLRFSSPWTFQTSRNQASRRSGIAVGVAGLVALVSACGGQSGDVGGSGGSGTPNVSTGGTSVPVSSTGGSGTGGSASSGSGTGGNASGGSGTGGVSDAGGRGTAGSGNGGRVGNGGARAGSGGSTGVGGAASTALCPPSALVCEDFEDGMANGWSALATGMAIDSVHARSGKNALSITIPANARGGFITMKGQPLFPLVNKTMWGRVMVWFDSTSDGHTDLIRGQSAAGGNPSYNVGEQHGAYLLNYYNGSNATDCWARPRAPTPTVVALNKWMCWEWTFNAGTNNMQLYVDGTLYRNVDMTGDGCLTGNGTWVAPTDFGQVSVGALIAETRPTIMQAWFDDIAIGTSQRIGCPAP